MNFLKSLTGSVSSTVGPKILCPYCFHSVLKKNIQYQCKARGCLDPGMIPHIIVGNKPDKDGFCTCDRCKQTTSTRVCPECKEVLPDNILKAETEIVSIVGARGSGKSYFVATLLKQIMENHILVKNYSYQYQISNLWAVKDKMQNEYNRRFKVNLDACQTLDGTTTVSDIIKDNPPLLVELDYTKNKSYKSKTYSFFDAAGENFENESELAAITPYMGNSKAIILILDPRQISVVNDKIIQQFPDLSEVSEKSYSYVLENVVKAIRNHQKLSSEKQISIPICITFSKWDLLIKTPELLPEDLSVSKKDWKLIGKYDENQINNASQEIRSLLNEWAPDLVNYAEQQFKTVNYFGFSAWGFAEVTDKGAPPIASYRVEDPFLWVLHKEGIV